eukprot:3281027-Rhodomonas_salina.4
MLLPGSGRHRQMTISKAGSNAAIFLSTHCDVLGSDIAEISMAFWVLTCMACCASSVFIGRRIGVRGKRRRCIALGNAYAFATRSPVLTKIGCYEHCAMVALPMRDSEDDGYPTPITPPNTHRSRSPLFSPLSEMAETLSESDASSSSGFGTSDDDSEEEEERGRRRKEGGRGRRGMARRGGIAEEEESTEEEESSGDVETEEEEEADKEAEGPVDGWMKDKNGNRYRWIDPDNTGEQAGAGDEEEEDEEEDEEDEEDGDEEEQRIGLGGVIGSEQFFEDEEGRAGIRAARDAMDDAAASAPADEEDEDEDESKQDEEEEDEDEAPRPGLGAGGWPV